MEYMHRDESLIGWYKENQHLGVQHHAVIICSGVQKQYKYNMDYKALFIH